MRKISEYIRGNYDHPPAIGAAFALFLVLSPLIVTGHPFLVFFSIGGLLIVGGGVIVTAFMSFDADDVRKALSAIRQTFEKQKMAKEDLETDITVIVYFARMLQEGNGMRNLETLVTSTGIRDPLLKYGLNMVLSDYSPDDVRAMMEGAADTGYEHDYAPVDVLQAMTSHGPAYGMVGTLVGMIAMLGSLSSGTSEMGPSLAVSFLSTLYGVLSARLICIPAASRLRRQIDARRFHHALMIEGMALLAAKKSAMYVQDRLNSFLRPEAYNYYDITARKAALAPRAKGAAAPATAAA
jgi:chemotaxis protein MotA